MNFFKKLFSKGKSKIFEDPDELGGKYMPEVVVPIDELFMLTFTEKGGKFLYCDDMCEAHDAFSKILKENNWQKSDVLCLENNLMAEFSSYNLNFTNSNAAKFHLSYCEYLIANVGGILVSSNQLKDKKLYELPDNLVFVSFTSQLTRDLSDGLQGIKNKKGSIPSNITTIQHFNKKQESDDFLSYGSTSKNTYLLLVEDL